MQTLLRTPLHERHLAAGARMVPFAGWEMPVQYEGVIPEHRAVREDCGVFDVSHMGELHVEGPTARELLQSLLSNDLDRLGDGDAQYTLLTNDEGGIVDDLIAYRITEFHYLLVVNAGNREAAYAWIKEREIRGSEVRDASDEYGLLAVQGPRSIERLGLPEARPFTHAMGELDGIEVMVNRTGYTGELGCELMCPAEDAPALWDAVVARGAVPCGLGARDTLRLEVCYPLHGNDITPVDRRDLRGPRLDVRAGQGLQRRRDAPAHQGGGAGAPARRLRDGREGRTARGHGNHRFRRLRRWRSDVGHALAHARQGHRARLRPGRRRDGGNRARRRRPRQSASSDRRTEADLQATGGLTATWPPPRATPRS